ncbi:CWF19-like protein 2 homolog isoform X1 [Salvia hispanica]|uniref:CWF19-like protein 2 homolog isoform X1 n=2 Tax=Salvia hispanica TaxID=49212 RepID=UPI002008FC65|nr:CWF19-like protein 2 homolog isoform X1 [Salvia hispanica]
MECDEDDNLRPHYDLFDCILLSELTFSGGTMFSGLKFIPRDHIDEEKDGKSYSSRKEKRKSGSSKEKLGKKSKHSRYSSSDDEGTERIKSGSRKKKKWYDSNEDLSSFSDESDSQSEGHDPKRHKNRKGEKKHEHRSKLKKKAKSRRRDYSSEYKSSGDSESERSGEERGHHRGEMENKLTTGSKGSQSQSSDLLREETGLGWMLRPKNSSDEISNKSSLVEPEEASVEEIKKDNPRELNPYLKDNGSGYPEESDSKAGQSTTVVGDGGASWRLKALKRSKEQAAREGRNLQQVVEERWGSMGQFAASVGSRDVASTHAHLQAINHRRKGLMKEEKKNLDVESNSAEKIDRKDITPRHSKMKMPKVHDSLSWGKRERNKMSAEDSALVSAAMSNLNKFSNDGNFMAAFMNKEEKSVDQSSSSKSEARADSSASVDFAFRENKEDVGTLGPPMSANQLAAKALQLRLKGRHEEAEKLMKEAENIKGKQDAGNESSRPQIDGTTSRYIMHDVSARQKRKEDDGDLHLAQRIAQNQRFSISNQADEEYDYDDGPRKKTRKKGGDSSRKSSEITNSANRILTQQERCQFCFENPSRPKHLVISIANFTYLAVPHQQPVVPGHCCILTLQHEISTRTVDNNVWDEIRNFKKCLIMMFAKQEKDVVFFETVVGLARQRRHCLVECIPVPRDIAKQAPLYFKKAIDEAEDEWSQHNAKKLIDTSEKGLRGSIPKNFPYFHVEFGLSKGFVHVIDDEKDFPGNFGLNVVRGMLQLPAEDMHGRRRKESVETQKQAVASFVKDWQPFDWTKQLD